MKSEIIKILLTNRLNLKEIPTHYKHSLSVQASKLRQIIKRIPIDSFNWDEEIYEAFWYTEESILKLRNNNPFIVIKLMNKLLN